MHRVVEKMGAAAVDEEDELLLVFWRLVGGALVVPVVFSVPLVDIFWMRGFGRGFVSQDTGLTFSLDEISMKFIPAGLQLIGGGGGWFHMTYMT